MVDHDDEAFDRLRAGDPATGSHPDLHRLRALLAHKAPASQGSERATALRDDELLGPRVPVPWIAAAAVAALALGVGGYAVGVSRTPDAPPLAGNPLTRDLSPAAPGMEPASGPAMTDLTSMGGDADTAMESDTSYPSYDPGPVRLTAGAGLSDARTTGEVSAVVSDEDPEEFLTAWMQRTGVSGTVVDHSDEGEWYTGFSVVDPDRGVHMNVDRGPGALTFSYDDVFGSEYCAEMYEGMSEQDLAVARDEWAAWMGEDVPFPDADSCRGVTGERPGDEQALAAARDFFADAGMELSGYTVELEEWNDPSSRFVQVHAWPDGAAQHGELTASASVGPDGVVNAYGSVGELTSLGDYPVISPVEAVQRYALREFSQEYGVSLPEEQYPAGDGTTWVEPTFTSPQNVAMEPGMRIPLLLKEKAVVDAELVTGSIWTQSGTSMQVPTWKLVTADGMSYPVLALADEAIDWQTWE